MDATISDDVWRLLRSPLLTPQRSDYKPVLSSYVGVPAMPHYSRIIVVWIVSLWVVTIIVGLLRLAPGRTRQNLIFTCNCDDTETTYIAYRWLSAGITHTYHNLEQLKNFLTGDEFNLCKEHRMGIWNSLFGRKPKERRGLLLTGICDAHALIAKLWSLSSSRKEWLAEFHDVGFRKFVTQKIKSSIQSSKQAFIAFVDIPDKVTSGSQLRTNTLTSLPLSKDIRSLLPGYHCLCVFLTGACLCLCWVFTLRWLPDCYKMFCKTLANQRRKRKNIKKVVGSKCVAMKLLKSGKTFHSFYMVSKGTGKGVFVKCNRQRASSTQRRGQAKAYKALNTLKHRNIIGLVDWISYGIYRGLVLEFAPFGNLKDAFPSNSRDIRIVDKMSIFKQTLSAVAFLHQAGVAHLNIRPGSVLVFDKWVRVKLSGFSRVTRMSKGGFCLLYDLHQLSKPAEVVAEEPFDGFKADIWALGSLLFYIIVGDIFHRETKSPLHTTILRALRDTDDSTKRILLSVLARLLSHLPCHRPTLGETQDCIEALAFSDKK